MELTASDLWSRVLESARSGLPEQSFRTWIGACSPLGLSDDELLLEAPTEFHAQWVEDKYGSLLSRVVGEVLGRPFTLTFRASVGSPGTPPPPVEVTSPAPEDPAPSGNPGSPGSTTQHGSSRVPGAGGHPQPPSERRVLDPDAPRRANLNERYTFDRFVVGTNNQLAAAASHAVAQQPARTYNPLFLYGGVGLGKTHLMHAVGHEILGRDPFRRVAYVTSERFMNEMVGAIQTGTTPEFRRRFRQIDLLLVDDVHFLQQKEGTQEEFFHTFNALYDAGKQIILTSDRPPKDLAGLEARLVSRFEWGLVADLKPPDFETRVAILRKKAADDDLILDDEIMDYIARSCTSSVRELEGAVIKLLAYSSLRKEEITVDMARSALQGVLRENGVGTSLTPEGIRNRVAMEWNVTSDGLASKRRTRELTEPRQVAMYLIKELLDEPLVRIGRLFGGRDHSTVIHSVTKVEAALEEGGDFALRVNRLRAELEALA
jgi:chromosomal replication initiator protein